MPEPELEAWTLLINTTDGPTLTATSAAGSDAFAATGALPVDVVDACVVAAATVVVLAESATGEESFSTILASPKPAAINAVATTAPTAAQRPRRSGTGALDGPDGDEPDPEPPSVLGRAVLGGSMAP